MFEKEIARGAELLDRHRPGWMLELDLANLDMSSCQACVVGQIMGDYTDGLEKMIGPHEVLYGEEYGFDLPVRAHEFVYVFGSDLEAQEIARTVMYQKLEREWTHFIKDRLDKGVDLGV